MATFETVMVVLEIDVMLFVEVARTVTVVVDALSVVYEDRVDVRKQAI